MSADVPAADFYADLHAMICGPDLHFGDCLFSVTMRQPSATATVERWVADHEAAVQAARDEGWNAALDAAQTTAANVPLNTDSTYVREWQLETWRGIHDAIAALRKPVQP